MKSFDSFSAAAALAKELAASKGASVSVLRSNQQWIVRSAEPEQDSATSMESKVEEIDDQIDRPYDFPVSAMQWRDLEYNRETLRRLDPTVRPFALHHSVSHLDPRDRLTLHKYGELLAELLKGRIRPVNEEQEHFVAVFKNGGKTRDGVERSWLNLLREVEYSKALAFSGKDEEQYRSKLRAIAKKGHKGAIELLKTLGSWDPNPPPDKGHRPDIKPIDYSRLGGRLMPGSFESGGS